MAIGDFADTSNNLNTLNTLRIFKISSHATGANKSPIKNGAKERKSIIFIPFITKAFLSDALINLYIYSHANIKDMIASTKRNVKKCISQNLGTVSRMIAPTAIKIHI